MTDIRSVFPGTVDPHGPVRHAFARQAPLVPAGIVYVSETGLETDDFRVKVTGTQIEAYVITDVVTDRYRIVLRDRLVADEILVDTTLPADARLRTAIAIAEGMVRGLALSLGVALTDFTPEG